MDLMKIKNLETVGIVAILAFVIISGVQAAYLSGFVQNVNVFATIFLTFFFTIIFFLALQLFTPKRITPIKKGGRYLLFVNLTTLGNWFSFFIALKYLEPAVVSAIANAVGPFITIIITVYIIRTETISWPEWLVVGAIFLSTFSLAVITYSGYSGVGNINVDYFWIGLVMSVVCGTSGVIHTLVSKQLNKRGIEPEQIMSVRFLLLILVAFFFTDLNIIIESFVLYWPAILLIALLGNVIALYFLQLGIKHTQPLNVSYLLTAMPLSYFAMEMFTSHIHFSWFSLLLVSATVFFMFCGIYLKSRVRIIK